MFFGNQVSFFMAFLAGFLSFISPCVLPLIPAYISFISGLSLEEIENRNGQNRKIIISSMFFILGFSLIFILLGATATFLGSFLITRINIFRKIAGIMIIIFGIHMAGWYRIKFLDFEKKVYTRNKPINMVIGPFLIGLAFAFGWTPCVGPVLASILMYASTQQTVYQGVLLLTIYSAGLGIPFFLTALAINKFYLLFNKIKRHYKTIELIGGLLLMIIGGLILTDNFQRLIYY